MSLTLGFSLRPPPLTGASLCGSCSVLFCFKTKCDPTCCFNSRVRCLAYPVFERCFK